MKVALFSSKSYDEAYFGRANAEADGGGHELVFNEFKLTPESARAASGCRAVCPFVHDQVGRETLEVLGDAGVQFVVLRCAGFNNVDLRAAEELGIVVARVPAYSPHAVAEHTIGLLLALNRRLYRAYNRVREGNFSLQGLVGFDIHGLTAGVVGTGTIGREVVRLFRGFGCEVLCHDLRPDEGVREMGGRYVASTEELFAGSDIISLHCPLTEETHHLVDAEAIATMRKGVTLLNTSRGGLVDTEAVVEGLKSGHIGNLGIDVYEEEASLFFEDQSSEVIKDDTFARLLTFPNVLITGHQAFFTSDALNEIAATTLRNLSELERDGTCANVIRAAG